MNATKFPDKVIIEALGFEPQLVELLNGTGFTGLYGMNALTYRNLTLEFLSTLELNEDDRTISFRVNNANHTLTFEQFGEHLNLSFADGKLRFPSTFDDKLLVYCISNKRIRSFTNVRVSSVQHPILRLWFRFLTGTYFGRTEIGTMNKTEAVILGSYLNVQGRRPFKLCLPYFVVMFWLEIASGQKATIEIGGLITILCERMGIFNPEGIYPIDDTLRYVSEDDLRRLHHWIRMRNGEYEFLITKNPEFFLHLPCELPPLTPLPRTEQGVEHELPSFLIPRDAGAQPAIMPMLEDVQPPPPQHFSSQYDEAGSSQQAPPAQPYGNPYYMDHFHFQNRQFAHYAANMQAMALPAFHREVISNQARPPYPSFYDGTNDPSSIYREAGIDMNEWGVNYGASYGGLGGQFLDEFGRMNMNANEEDPEGEGGEDGDGDDDEDEA